MDNFECMENGENFKGTFSFICTPPVLVSCDYENCPKIAGGMFFKNHNGQFPEMKKDEEMHLGCYVRHCVDCSLEKKGSSLLPHVDHKRHEKTNDESQTDSDHDNKWD